MRISDWSSDVCSSDLFGVWLYGFLRSLGQLDLVISLCYVIFLGFVDILMFIESSRALFRRRRQTDIRRKLHQHHWLHGLPLKMRFRKSKLYIPALLPIMIGFLVGVLAAKLGRASCRERVCPYG